MSSRPPLPKSPPPPPRATVHEEDDVSTSSSVAIDPLHQKSTIQSPFQKFDQGTVGAVVAQEGDDLSYDLSSQESLVGDDEDDHPAEGGTPTDDSCTIVSKDGGHLNLKESDPYISFDEECREYLKAKGSRGSIPREEEEDNKGVVEKETKQQVHEEPEGLSEENPTLEMMAKWIQEGKCRKIVVLSGAGVSCSAGIPDFRTPGTGLYDNLEKYNLPYPEAVFDLSFYKSNPKPFVSLAKELWPGQKHSPTLSHSFVSLLDSKDLLVRNYTQNIDGLEILAGVTESKLVECHGHFRSATCTNCGVPMNWKECFTSIVENEEVPICTKCGSYVKPDIVFFGESLPVRYQKCIREDLVKTDLLIVMGTSLKVAPVSLIPEMVNTSCRRILFNRELVGDFVPPGVFGNYRDVFWEGDCDDGVRQLCEYLGWEDELLKLNESTKIEDV